MSEMTIRALIDSKLGDHKVNDAEYQDVLSQVKYGWISKDEILEAHAVVAQAKTDLDEAFKGVGGAIARALVEALQNGNINLEALGDHAGPAVDAMARRDAAEKLVTDLTAARNGDPEKGIAKQGFLANAAADLLPESWAGALQSLF